MTGPQAPAWQVPAQVPAQQVPAQVPAQQVPARRVPGWLVTAGMLVLLVAVGLGVNALNEHAPPQGPTSVRMSLGQDALVHPLQLNVAGARAYETILGEDDEPLESVGVWVLVDLSYATVDEPRLPGDFYLVDAQGRRYPITNRGFGTWQAGPDLWQRGTLVFEIPTDALGDLTFEAWPGGQGSSGEVPLPYGVLALEVGPDLVEPGPGVVESEELLAVGDR